MKEYAKEKIEQIIHQRKVAHSYYLKNSESYKAFADMEQATFKDGAVSKKTKELAAIGISVAIDCDSCMEWHIREALEQGASEEEIVEIIGVGMEMACGKATVSSRFAMNVLDYYRRK